MTAVHKVKFTINFYWLICLVKLIFFLSKISIILRVMIVNDNQLKRVLNINLRFLKPYSILDYPILSVSENWENWVQGTHVSAYSRTFYIA